MLLILAHANVHRMATARRAIGTGNGWDNETGVSIGRLWAAHEVCVAKYLVVRPCLQSDAHSTKVESNLPIPGGVVLGFNLPTLLWAEAASVED
jgi:hypothetical protein